MPNIREYTNKIDGIETNPLSRAANAYSDLARTKAYAGQAIGRSIGSGIAEIGEGVQAYRDEVERHDTMTEITQAAPVIGKAQLDLNTEYNQGMATVDDNLAADYAQKFLTERFEPEAQKLMDSATTEGGKKYIFGQIQSWREHMQNKVSADLSTKAGAAVQKNLTASVRLNSTMVQGDPTTRELALGNIDNSWNQIRENNKYLTPQQIAAGDEYVVKAKDDINEAYFTGLILANPTAAKEKLMNDADPAVKELPVDQRMRLLGSAEAWEGRKSADVNYQREQAEREIKAKSEAKAGTYLESFYQGGKFVIPPGTDERIIHDPDLTQADQGRLFTMINKIQRFGEGQGDDGVFNRFYAATLTGKPPTQVEIAEAVTNNQLKPSEANTLLKMTKTADGKTPPSATEVVKATYAEATAKLNPKNGMGASLMADGTGEARVKDFSIWMNQLLDSGRAQGMADDDILSDKRNIEKIQQEIRFLQQKNYELGGQFGTGAPVTGNQPAGKVEDIGKEFGL